MNGIHGCAALDAVSTRVRWTQVRLQPGRPLAPVGNHVHVYTRSHEPSLRQQLPASAADAAFAQHGFDDTHWTVIDIPRPAWQVQTDRRSRGLPPSKEATSAWAWRLCRACVGARACRSAVATCSRTHTLSRTFHHAGHNMSWLFFM